jgi:hypothetical protein
MKRELKRVAPLQAGKVMGLLGFFLGVCFMPFFILPLMFAPKMPHNGGPPVVLFFLFPIFYAISGFLFTALMAWIYNFVAGWIGGVVYETVET